jgi:putative endonuclease
VPTAKPRVAKAGRDASASISPDPRVALGRAAECAAEALLLERGYEIVARNVRACGAEIDVIAREGEMIVFVEVRSRSNRRHGAAVETIGARKRARIARAALAYLVRTGQSQRPARFDVIGVDWVDGRPQCTLFRNAFESPT